MHFTKQALHFTPACHLPVCCLHAAATAGRRQENVGHTSTYLFACLCSQAAVQDGAFQRAACHPRWLWRQEGLRFFLSGPVNGAIAFWLEGILPAR